MTASAPTSANPQTELATARATYQRVIEQRAALEATLASAHRIGGYTNCFSDDETIHADAEAILRARVLLADAPRQLTALRIEELRAKRALDVAEHAERQAAMRALDGQRRVEVKKLDELLASAARVNARVAALDERAQQLGLSAAVFSWHELQPETALAQSRWTVWQRHAREHGMLD